MISRFLRSYLPGYTGNDAAQVIQQIVSGTQPEDIRTFFESYILSVWPLVRETSQPSSDVLLQIKQYIKEHFMENITLQQLSDVFYLHPNYLSRLFKEKGGQRFIDYLTTVRVENAKELLANSSLKINDIGPMVGYETPKYFGKIFKETTGMTPREYRDARRK